MYSVAFYAINGVGLGHIARLSVVQRYMIECYPEVTMQAYCQSKHGHSFFTCPCTHVATSEALKQELGLYGLRKYVTFLCTKCFPSQRRTYIFDTFWPARTVKRLRAGGNRVFLILRGFKPDEMYATLQKALAQFDYVFFPCEDDELAYSYRDHAGLWELLNAPQCEAVGPIVRTSEVHDDARKVIFTVGGGGEHENEDPRHSVRNFLKQYVAAGRVLYDAGVQNIYIAKGPMMKIDIDLGPVQILETLKLPEHFGAHTSVVTRGTYNLSWETIAAGATLVTTKKSEVSAENSDIRNQYLVDKGYAYSAELDGAALAQAILQPPPENLDEAKALVCERRGLRRIAELACADKP